MQQDAFRHWLEARKYEANTVKVQIYRAGRVEEFHGNLDDHYREDRMEALLQSLAYSNEDRRYGRPNPSKIPFQGDILSNLRSYRDAVVRYRRFRDDQGVTSEAEDHEHPDFSTAGHVADAAPDADGQRFGLERDMQAALRKNIGQLEAGLEITDEGAERSVSSGFIDITAKDANGLPVVIELKTGTAGQRAVAQILSYMGDVSFEEGQTVRGILVASDFDAKAKAAARMVPSLELRRYSVRFQFSNGAE